MSVFHPHPDLIPALIDKARSAIPEIAVPEVVLRVVKQNPDALWAIARRGNGALPEGFIATLPVTEYGLDQLVRGTFCGTNPDPGAVAPANTQPAAIYIWCVYAPGPLIAAVPLVFEELSKPLYREADILARAATPAGERLSEVLGLKRGVRINGVPVTHLYVYQRAWPVQSNKPPYDSYRPHPGERDLSVTVARSFDDLLRVVGIRSAVYLSEQACPFDEEFDGNDLAATHLLGYVGSEPAGCLRIRYFADFAKFERMAVRREFRHTRLAFQLIQAGVALCRKKGYRRLYGHAQKRLVRFWRRFGFEPLAGGREFSFSDFNYVEMVAQVDGDRDPLAIGADPYVLIRPEGRWHEPGILERSAGRGTPPPLLLDAAP
jgi:predicted GNAT family N-acyltransferase